MEFDKEFLRKCDWCLTNILFPTIPFFIGAIILVLYYQKFYWSVFNPTVLSISMVMLSYILLSHINKLDDDILKSMLSKTLLSIGGIFFHHFWNYNLDIC